MSCGEGEGGRGRALLYQYRNKPKLSLKVTFGLKTLV